MECQYCKNPCVKAGFQRNGLQKYHCKSCRKYQQLVYVKHAFREGISKQIVSLLVEGLGLRSIARILRISLTTVINRIRRIARSINRPLQRRATSVCEIDELWTYVGRKSAETWITYALDRANRSVVDFSVGPRTRVNLKTVTDTTLACEPLKVCTDGLNVYRSLIPRSIHHVGLSHTRHIERFNLNLRTHLKRLSRKTIWFSRSKSMLECCLRIYFWTPYTSVSANCVHRFGMGR